MNEWLWLQGLAAGAGVGFVMGLTGAGGSMLAVPLLVYGLSQEPHAAVGTALAAVGCAALSGSIPRIVRHEVDYRSALLLGPAGMAGAPAGTWLRTRLAAEGLMVSFAVVMVLVAAKMWYGAGAESAARDADRAAPSAPLSPLVLGVVGVLMGVFSGLFGVGGAIVTVPVLAFLVGLTIHRAVATSLVIVALVSSVAFVSHLAMGQPIDSQLAPWFVAGAVAGAVLGQRAAAALSGLLLQRLFAVLVVAVALFTLFSCGT